MLGAEELLGNAGPPNSESQAAESVRLLGCFRRLPLSVCSQCSDGSLPLLPLQGPRRVLTSSSAPPAAASGQPSSLVPL